MVTWTDHSLSAGDISGDSVRAKIFNANGSKSGSEYLVNTTTVNQQQFPVSTALADGRFVVAWQDDSQTGADTSSIAVRAQVFNSDGSSGAEFLVNTTTAYEQQFPTITALEDGRFVVAWEDQSQTGDTSSWAVRAQIFNPDGSQSGSEFLVNTTTLANQSAATVTTLSDGRFVVAWQDGSASGGDTSFSAVRAQVFDPDGSKSGSEFLVNTTTTGMKVVREAHLLDRLQLELEALAELRCRPFRSAFSSALLAQLDEVLEGVAAVGRRELREQDPAELDLDVAALGDLERPAQRVFVAGEVGGHLLRRLEVELVGLERQWFGFLSESPDWMQSSASWARASSCRR